MTKQILVYADWDGLKEPLLIGHLTADMVRGKEIFSFAYAEEWLQSPNSQLLDPDLQLFAGPQYLGDDKPNFGLFLDSSPDRWGRVLMKRHEAILARQEERKQATLNETDFLLGVYDGNRMGGLRFKLSADGPFMSHQKDLAAPPWVNLRDLEYASLRLEKDDIKDDEELKWLNLLLAPGSSLGGARPKASISDIDGNLWIAKFPSLNDDRDIGAWEMVVHELAGKSGLDVAPAKLQKFSGRHHTFLTSRFDRIGQKRIHFASAMTLLGYMDGTDHHNGVSYLELAGFIQQNGRNVSSNLKELWSRIVFNILVKNIDDHLRNHGFLLRPDGWELSPAYDMNAIPEGNGLTLNISEDDNSLDLDLALQVSPHFRIKPAEAAEIIDRIKKAVGQWQDIASAYKLSRKEQEMMGSIFNLSS